MGMLQRLPVAACLVLAASGAHGSAGVVADVFGDYDELLSRYVIEKRLDNDGLVSAFDYATALADADTEALLERQSGKLADFDIDRLDTREKGIAFWNNAYNYFMIKQILTELDDGELVGSVWDYGGRYNPFRDSVFTREKWDIGGRDYSLDEMEKGILLGDDYAEKGWWEARVHFTVNCASVGCPPLRDTIYTADNVDDLMAENTRRALNTPYHLELDGSTLKLTQLFEWYEDDYVKEAGSVKDFIRAHADDHIIEKVDQADRIRFISYDWDLNTPANFPELQ